MPTVSVVIPTFNRVRELERALRSVVSQTHAADEVIVVDDGSTDATGDMVAATFPGVRYIARDNSGVSASRNAGVAASRCEWIAFLDSDDEWRPEKLARQLEAIANDSTTRICHTDEIWIRNGRRVNPGKRHAKSGGFIFKQCLPLCAISPSSVMIERALLDETGGFDEELPACEDYDLWLRICCEHPVLYVDEPLVVKYGGHDDQLSRRHWGMDRFRVRALARIIDSGKLNEDDRRAAVETLCEKLDVFIGGLRKRDRAGELAHYESLMAKYAPDRSRRSGTSTSP